MYELGGDNTVERSPGEYVGEAGQSLACHLSCRTIQAWRRCSPHSIARNLLRFLLHGVDRVLAIIAEVRGWRRGAVADVTGNGALEKQCQGNGHLLDLCCHQTAQLHRPEMISVGIGKQSNVKTNIDLVVAMSSLGVASSSLAVSSMVRPSEVDSPPFTRLINCMKKSG